MYTQDKQRETKKVTDWKFNPPATLQSHLSLFKSNGVGINAVLIYDVVECANCIPNDLLSMLASITNERAIESRRANERVKRARPARLKPYDGTSSHFTSFLNKNGYMHVL